MLSDRFKYAVKLGAALTLAYGTSLAMGWDSPLWAGLSVTLCSLSTTGESLLKGSLRVLGTLVALVVSLSLIALFPQERWSFLFAISLFIALCTYAIGGTRHWYFWFVAAFSTPLLSMAGGADGLNDFTIVVLRAQQTLMGVAAYTLVGLLIWPASSQASFETSTTALLSALHDLFGHHLSRTIDRPDARDAQALRMQATSLLGRLPSLLDAALIDSYEVEEAGPAWRRSLRLLQSLNESLEGLRLSAEDTNHLFLQGFLPGNRPFVARLNGRFEDLKSMMSGQPPGEQRAAPNLKVQQAALASLPHFDQAAIRLLRDRLLEIDRLTQDLVASIAEAKGFSPLRTREEVSTVPLLPRLLDPDRWIAVLRVQGVFWLSTFAILFLPDLPSSTLVLVVSLSISMTVATQVPQFRPYLLLGPILIGSLVGGVAHLLIMPQLSGFPQLGVLLFAVAFFFAYHYPQATKGIYQTTILSLFMMLIQVENDQKYSFYTVANDIVAFILFIVILVIALYLPTQLRAEAMVRSVLRRFFAGCACLQNPDRAPWQNAMAAYAVARLPGRLPGLIHALPKGAVTKESRVQIEAFATASQALSYKVAALDDARGEPLARPVVEALSEDGKRWRDALKQVFDQLSDHPAGLDSSILRSRLDTAMERLEQRIHEVTASLGEAAITQGESESLYRLLGSYRAVSESVIDLSARAEGVDWHRLSEARF